MQTIIPWTPLSEDNLPKEDDVYILDDMGCVKEAQFYFSDLGDGEIDWSFSCHSWRLEKEEVKAWCHKKDVRTVE